MSVTHAGSPVGATKATTSFWASKALSAAEETASYREAGVVSRIESVQQVRWAGYELHGPVADYGDEVRAGIVIIACHHLLVGALGWVLAPVAG